jgi:ankyrin repeat protein
MPPASIENGIRYIEIMSAHSTLTQALLDGKMDEARALIAAGETVEAQYFQNNRTQIFRNLVRHKAAEIVDFLIKGGQIQTDIYELDTFEYSFYQALAKETTEEESSLGFLKAFLDKTGNRNDEVKGQTLLGFFLHESAAPAAIQCLIETGCDVRYKDNAERNFIHHVIGTRMQRNELKLAYLQLLIQEGVEVDAKDIEGNTTLLAAVKENLPGGFIELLLQQDANPNEQNHKGITAFYEAVTRQQGKETYQLLKQFSSPDFDLTTKDGQHLFTSFVKGLSDNPPESQKALLLELLQDGANIYQTSPYYEAPKSGADWIAEKSVELLKTVLDAGAIEINRRDDKGNTLLHKVCGFNVNYDVNAAKETYRKAKLLLEAGADPELTNDKDETPLTLAQQDNLKIKTVELLLKAK